MNVANIEAAVLDKHCPNLHFQLSPCTFVVVMVSHFYQNRAMYVM